MREDELHALGMSPPPRFLKGESMTLVIDVWQEILRTDAAPWVRQHYVTRLKDNVEMRHWLRRQHPSADR
ncbi:MAG: hypothetical protein EXR98_12845 [Gemmataceae bacterium]|nr:hypothetical protein [Gemmataceae bacterium]